MVMAWYAWCKSMKRKGGRDRKDDGDSDRDDNEDGRCDEKDVTWVCAGLGLEWSDMGHGA